MWDSFDKHFSTTPNEVTNELFIGSMESSTDKNILQNLGITHIVVAGSYLKKNFPDTFQYYSIEINDADYENISQYFNNSFDFIDNAISNNGKVLIHCAAGVSRSSTILISYLMKKNKWKYDFTYDFVKKQRNCVSPNYGFIKQLQTYEKELKIE